MFAQIYSQIFAQIFDPTNICTNMCTNTLQILRLQILVQIFVHIYVCTYLWLFTNICTNICTNMCTNVPADPVSPFQFLKTYTVANNSFQDKVIRSFTLVDPLRQQTLSGNKICYNNSTVNVLIFLFYWMIDYELSSDNTSETINTM